MHASERLSIIENEVRRLGFVTFRHLEGLLNASPATIRRDLARLALEGKIERVHGGVNLVDGGDSQARLAGASFHENKAMYPEEKLAIGRVAASLCDAGEAVMIDGGSTTLQMCPFVDGLSLQVLTNSLHIVNALLPQRNTKIIVPAGTVFREQNIILSASGEDSMPRFHAPKLFLGAAAIGPQGLMQADVILVASERRLIDRAEQIIVLVDHSKFVKSSGNVVCGLKEIDTVVTDAGVAKEHVQMLEEAGVNVILAQQGSGPSGYRK